MTSMQEMTNDRNKHRREVEQLVEVVEGFLLGVDKVMQMPASPEKGRKIALLCNGLEMAKDHAKHFGLGKSLKRTSKRVMEAIEERDRAVKIIRQYLLFSDQRSVSCHEVNDCIDAIQSLNPNLGTAAER